MRHFHFALLFALTIAAFESCTSSKEISSTPESKPADGVAAHESPQEREATEKFVEGNKMEMLGDNQQALNLYRECLRIYPGIDAAYYNIAKILYAQKQYADALQNVQQAVRLSPDNTWYLDLYGTLLGGTGNYKEAIKVYQHLVQLDPDNPDAWFNLAFFTEQNKQYENAIGIFNQIEQRFGVAEQVSTEKAKLWMTLGKKDKAAAELQNLINANADEPKYYSLLIDFYMSNGMEDKAYDVLQKLIALNPDDPKAYLVLAGYYERKHDDAKAKEAFKKSFSNPELDVDFAIPILVGYLRYFQNPDSSNPAKKEEALELSQALAQSHPTEPKATAMYGDLLYQDDQFDSALVQYNKTLALDNSRFLVWQQLFFIYDHNRNYDSLLAVSKRATELFPDQSYAFYFNGYANMQLKKYDAAVVSLGKAIEIGAGNKQFLSQMYADMGDAYYYLKNNHASDSCYDLALVFDPSNAYVLNNYSYFLSLRGDKLDEAEKMAERATIVAPNTSAYEDTYGWVLYKEGKYTEAKEWIGKALSHGADTDGTVLEHYGDVSYKLGDVDLAVQYWMKAKAAKVDSSTIDKKIAERKLYE